VQVEEPVRRDDNPVEDSEIFPDTIPATRFVANVPGILLGSIGLNYRSRRILVRSEYEEAERAALLATRNCMNPFVVTGQPGIGRSPTSLDPSTTHRGRPGIL